MSFRTERDPLGAVQVPAGAYYGAQTVRAVENFPISGLHAPADLVTATVLVKKAAAEANMALGRLDPAVARAIVAAADDILVAGKLRDQFVVDVYQAGAGTSHNMNANEVLANRAAEILGEPRGADVRVHPSDHVNMGQSTNDVFPTVLREAMKALRTRTVDGLAANARARPQHSDRDSPEPAHRLRRYRRDCEGIDQDRQADPGACARARPLHTNELDAILSVDAMTRGGIVGSEKAGEAARKGLADGPAESGRTRKAGGAETS